MRHGIERSRELRRNATDAERLLWRYLRHKQCLGQRFRRQHLIGPYIVDFACLEQHLVIELDGLQHADAHRYDTQRTHYLSYLGWHVLRFWNHDVLKQPEAVITAVINAFTRKSQNC